MFLSQLLSVVSDAGIRAQQAAPEDVGSKRRLLSEDLLEFGLKGALCLKTTLLAVGTLSAFDTAIRAEHPGGTDRI